MGNNHHTRDSWCKDRINKMIKWLFARLSRSKQKAFIVEALATLLKSKDSSIDQEFAVLLIEMITASKGNTITAFLLREK